MSVRSLALPALSKKPAEKPRGRPALALGERALVVTLMVACWAGASLISLVGRR